MRYFCIDLKSFYASVEAVDRGLDPAHAKIVVADYARSGNTICLALSIALKALGYPGRCRLKEVADIERIIIAKPRMKRYINMAAQVYGVYLKYFSRDDIHVYSIDEAFIDFAPYLSLYHLQPEQLARLVLDDIKATTGLPAACGIGENLFLAKIALDRLAKKNPDQVASLRKDEFVRLFGDHKPLTDFWHIGPGTVERLAKYQIYTLNDIASASIQVLKKEFGVNYQILVDHAQGHEPTTIKEIKSYKPTDKSLSSGQVLERDYNKEEGLVVIKEMVGEVCQRLKEQGLTTALVAILVSGTNGARLHASFAINPTASQARIRKLVTDRYLAEVGAGAKIRRVGISLGHLGSFANLPIDFFGEFEQEVKEQQVSKTISDIKKKFGRNSIISGTNLQKGATGRQRNQQVGGHHE